MSGLNTLASKFLKKGEAPSLKREPINGFRNLFEVQTVDDAERLELVSMLKNPVISEDEQKSDLERLCQITSEVRSIQKQGVILVGERVHHARELLNKYGERSFSKWIGQVFGSRKSAYNALAYFELYQQLSTSELKQKMKKLPVKATYILASREGKLSTKEELIENYHGEKQEEFIDQIQLKFPTKGKKFKERSDEYAHLRRLISRWKRTATPRERDELIALICD